MENLEVIGRIHEKYRKNKKISKGDMSQLIENFRKISDYSCLILELNKFNEEVTFSFLKEMFSKGELEKGKFIDWYISSDKFKQNKQKFILKRGLGIINILLEANDYGDYTQQLLRICANKAKADTNKDEAARLLGEICFNHTGAKIFNVDKSGWHDEEQVGYVEWVKSAIKFTSNVEVLEAHDKLFVKNIQNEPEKLSSNIKKGIEAERFLKLVDEIKNEWYKKECQIREIQKSFNEEQEKMRYALESEKQEKESMINQRNIIKREKEKFEQKYIQEANKYKSKEKELIDIKATINHDDDVRRRAIRQEVEALKNELSNKLRIEFSDFQELQNIQSEQYQTYYESLLNTMARVFDKLERSGIKLR